MTRRKDSRRQSFAVVVLQQRARLQAMIIYCTIILTKNKKQYACLMHTRKNELEEEPQDEPETTATTNSDHAAQQMARINDHNGGIVPQSYAYNNQIITELVPEVPEVPEVQV
jgi:hypothetical protein